MEHFYVVSGNEYGMDISTKRNFPRSAAAYDHYRKVKDEDCACCLVYVDPNGKETILESVFDY